MLKGLSKFKDKSKRGCVLLEVGDDVKVLPRYAQNPTYIGKVKSIEQKNGQETQYGIEVGLPYLVWRFDSELVKLKG